MSKLESQTETEVGDAAAARLAHALTAPLDGLLALGELLQNQPLPEDARVQVGGMLAAGRRMARLLCDAIETDDLTSPPDLSPTSLRELVDDVESHWRSRLNDPAAQILVCCNAPADLRLLVDPARLSRFFHTLIEEAMETRAWGMVELQVDVGFAADGAVIILGRLEAPGATAPAGDKASLALCRTIADQMNGDVTALANVGGGLQLSFALNADKAGDTLALEGENAEDHGPLPPRTHLLIVDDNATNRIVAAALCEMFGCTSETAEDGLEAVEAVKSRQFDVILMDIKMPRMDGLEATRAIRALGSPAADTPIVAITANADPDAVASYLACGMRAVVDKPIKPEHLLRVLQDVLYEGEDAAESSHVAAA